MSPSTYSISIILIYVILREFDKIKIRRWIFGFSTAPLLVIIVTCSFICHCAMMSKKAILFITSTLTYFFFYGFLLLSGQIFISTRIRQEKIRRWMFSC
jgi:hypothetical protein